MNMLRSQIAPRLISIPCSSGGQARCCLIGRKRMLPPPGSRQIRNMSTLDQALQASATATKHARRRNIIAGVVVIALLATTYGGWAFPSVYLGRD
jgi:hypothetical protein